uniref:Poly [ADP-ribose] polymerase n=1 Tax=Zooxanthella nutricula TaxID=1333877 RepID=A0A7S2LU42_9DINO
MRSPRRSASGDSVSTSASRCGPALSPEEEELDEEMRALCLKIDADSNGSISELELIEAVRRYPEVAAFVLPGVDPATLMEDERAFDSIDETFERIAAGKQRIRYSDFATHFRRAAAERTSNGEELRELYRRIDADGSGGVSKLELLDAVQRCREVAALVLPDGDAKEVLNDEETFELVKNVFERVAGGKKRFDYADFEAYFRRVEASGAVPFRATSDRASKRVLIIGPGFGRQMNPRQGAMIDEAGFQTQWCWEGLPNPEQPSFDVRPFLPKIKAAIDEFDPDVVACASKGGAYMAGLWAHNLWRGPSLLINAHPSCAKLPEGVPVVVCQGSNDEVYPTPRAKLEEVIATGTPNMVFLYYTANSGKLPTGHLSRIGDQHNMQSILNHDCLPRLIDAALSPGGPELHVVRSWRDRLTEQRLAAEHSLGYSPDLLRKRWASPSHRGCDEHKLFEVPRSSEEFAHVAAVFKAQPREKPAYFLSPPETWERVRILKVERVENGALHDDCTVPYYRSLRRSIEDQGLEFEPGVHTSWAFHGADADAIDSIVSNPVAGFQPLTSGSRGASLWGSGTYFARDAKYVADGGFCGKPAADGTRRMLMCLLMTGMPCLGDPQHKGVLPFRNRPHRYNCSVDCLSSPEVYITQHSGASHASYLITFA